MKTGRSHKRLKIVFITAGAVVAVMIIAMAVYFGTYYHSVDVDAYFTDTELPDEESASAETVSEAPEDSDAEASQTDAEASQTETKRTSSEAGEAGHTDTKSEAITEKEAREIAIADSGLSESEIKYINIWTEKEDGQWVYAVEFGNYDDTEYKYAIDMYTGGITASYIESH